MIKVQKNLKTIKRMNKRENLQGQLPFATQSYWKMDLHEMVLKTFAMST